MTRPAEFITIELDDEDGIWAPVSHGTFFGRDDGWTPQRVGDWFRETAPPRQGLGKLLGAPETMMISTALRGGAMRYEVRAGLLFPKWAVISVVDEEAFAARELPPECSIERGQHTLILRFENAAALSLAEPLGIVRCDDSYDDLHWYVEGESRFKREPERFIAASDGADGLC